MLKSNFISFKVNHKKHEIIVSTPSITKNKNIILILAEN